MNVITTTRQGCVLLCVGALSVPVRLRMALVVAATAGLLAGCNSEAEPTTGANGSGTPAPTATQKVSSPPEVQEAGPFVPAGAAPACMSVEARQADEAEASAYLVSRGWEPSRAAAVVRKMNGGGVNCW
jgi:hypothetical protein